MNQPAEERLKRLEEEQRQLKEQVRRLEQETEPIRLERRLSIPEANTLQTIMDMAGRQATDIGTLKQAVERIETTMEKRLNAIAEVQKQILDRLPPKSDK